MAVLHVVSGVYWWCAWVVGFCVPVAPPVALPGAVVRPFRAPVCERCPGHRGVTVAVAAGTAVRAPLPGHITFDGTVAGRRFVVLAPGPGILLTYGDLAPAGNLGPAGDAARGDTRRTRTVAPGDVLGYSTGEVYVGVRDHGAPVDPARVFGGSRPRLVPPGSRVCPVGGPAGSR